MRIISASAVKDSAAHHPDAGQALGKWLELIEQAEWRNLVEVRSVMPTADQVIVDSGRPVVVFNIGGNKYRLIAAIHYDKQRVYAMEFLTHAEYDKDKWKKVL